MEFAKINSTAALSTDKRVLVVQTELASQIASLLPEGESRVIPTKSIPLLQVTYHSQAIRVLKNMGIDVTGLEPISHFYTYPTVKDGSKEFEFREHQKITAAFLSMNYRAFITSTMRTGKTASMLAAIDYLQMYCGLTSVLIVTTLSTIRTVWLKEALGLFGERKKVVVLHDPDVRKRKEALKGGADIYITNYEGPELLESELIAKVEDGSLDAVIVDELTHYSKATSNRWKILNKIVNGIRYDTIPVEREVNGVKVKLKDKIVHLPKGRPVTYCWGATGTPGNPTDVYGEVKLINPANMNMSFVSWRNVVQVRSLYSSFTWLNRPDFLDQIYKVMQPCIRFDKEHVMPDIPKAPEPIKLHVPLTPEQHKFYKQLKKNLVAEYRENKEALRINEVALITKLIQASGGAVIGEDTTIQLDLTNKIDKLMEVINSGTGKTVIFAAFKAVIERLVTELSARGLTVDYVHGDITGKKRDHIFNSFQNTANPQVLICHEKTAAYGVELAAADKLVFYGPPRSGTVVYQQAMERMSSLKQTASSIYIYHMYSTVEEQTLFMNVTNNEEEAKLINNLFTKILDEV